MYKAGGFRLPSVGVLYLASILKNAGHKVRVYDEQVTRITKKGKNDELQDEVFQADAFGISIITPTALRGYRFAAQLRKKKPRAKIVYGGYHASALPEEPFHLGCADYVVVREGENVVLDVFENWPKEKILDGGLSDVNRLPVADFSLIKDFQRITHFPIVASRGCPYNCNFCQVPVMLGRKYRLRKVENIYEELRERRKRGEERLFFNDDIFGLKIEETKKLLEMMIKTGLKFHSWSAETRANVLCKDEELLDLMEKTRCSYLHIGAESATQASLESYGKDQRVEEVKEAVKAAHHRHIRINGMFIIGADEDTQEVVGKTFSFYRKMGFDTATFSILYPIPKTPIFDSLKSQGRIFTENWTLYDGSHVVFKPKNLSPFELQRAWDRLWRKAYPLWNKYSLPIKIFLRRWKKINREYIKALSSGIENFNLNLKVI